MKYLGIIFLCWNMAFTQVNQVDAKGKKQGLWYKTYPGTRFRIYEGNFKDDKPVGVFTYYYESGTIKAIIDHKPNTKRSEVKMYFENQSLMSVGCYLDQKKDSIWLNYSEAGELVSTETYADDKLNGKKTVYYLKDQLEAGSLIIMSTCNYVNNQRHGNYQEFHPSGKLKLIGEYANGFKIGEWKEYYNSGQLMSKSPYRNDMVHGWSYYYDRNGNLLAKSLWRDNKKLEGKELEVFLEYCKKHKLEPNF